MWFEDHLKSLKEPEQSKKVWKQHPEKLTILFIESDRKEWCKYNLWNLAHVYGGTDAGLHIICSPRNIDAMREYTKDWTNVVISWNPLRTVAEFSRFVTSREFHERFTSSHILVTSWDSYIFRKIDEKYFDYDYVGAPYYGTLIGYTQQQYSIYDKNIKRHYRIGNGGFSLRKMSSCLEHCIKNKHKNRDIEDIFFAISDLKVPSIRDAYDFSVESRITDEEAPLRPIGMHKIWDWSGAGGILDYKGFTEQDFKEWCST
jgi:hypothetical protein